MKEIRIHGRGGQGAVVMAQMLARAFIYEGKHAHAFPRFTFERRGAPVVTFFRFDDKPVREKTEIYYPDCSVVIDSRLAHSPVIFEGVKPNGILVLNTAKLVAEEYPNNLSIIGAVDATGIGLLELGSAITNTCMLGAVARVTGWVHLDSILHVLKDSFPGRVLDKNLRCAQRGFEEATIIAVSSKEKV